MVPTSLSFRRPFRASHAPRLHCRCCGLRPRGGGGGFGGRALHCQSPPCFPKDRQRCPPPPPYTSSPLISAQFADSGPAPPPLHCGAAPRPFPGASEVPPHGPRRSIRRGRRTFENRCVGAAVGSACIQAIVLGLACANRLPAHVCVWRGGGGGGANEVECRRGPQWCDRHDPPHGEAEPAGPHSGWRSLIVHTLAVTRHFEKHSSQREGGGGGAVLYVR